VQRVAGCCAERGQARCSCTSSSHGKHHRSGQRAGRRQGLVVRRSAHRSVAGRSVVPHFLREHDHPWLRALLEEHERSFGRPQRELESPAARAASVPEPPKEASDLPSRCFLDFGPALGRRRLPPRRHGRSSSGGGAGTLALPHNVPVRGGRLSRRDPRGPARFAVRPTCPANGSSVAPAQAVLNYRAALRRQPRAAFRRPLRATVVRIEVRETPRTSGPHANGETDLHRRLKIRAPPTPHSNSRGHRVVSSHPALLGGALG